jgi:phospholipid/cholesterol/gamma-HCH transport system substrate-binding protein
MLRPGTFTNLALVSGFAAVCLSGLVYLAVNIGLRYPGETGYPLSATFKEASGLVPQDEVRIAGVKVGNVLSVEPDSRGTTRVRMMLEPRYQVRSDVRAIARPKSLLGTEYVELVRVPGSHSPLLPAGSTIPLERTGQAVQIDDVLNNLDPETRKAMSTSFQQLGVALEGRSGDLNSSLPGLDQVATNLRPLAQVGDRRQEELARILVDLDTILQALADEQDSLGRLVDSGNTVFSGVAARDRDLGGAIQNANGFLASLDATFSSPGVTEADRTSLAQAPATINANSHTLSLTNGQVDQLLPALLLGQVNYPNDQLTVSQKESLDLAAEWISAFFQHDLNGNSFRITSITPGPKPPSSSSSTPPSSPASPASPAAPAGGPPSPPPAPTPPPDLLCLIVGGKC